jgi:hypothetical protein
MATRTINYYALWDKGDRDVKCFRDVSDLKILLSQSFSLKIFFNSQNDDFIEATYKKNMTANAYKGTEAAKFLGNQFEWTFEELIENLKDVKVFSFIIICQKEIESLFSYYKKKEIDWSQTITDLELEGIVKTLETESFMATDSRKFWFSKEGLNTAVDVDCLGIDLNKSINEKVKSSWAGIPK